MQSKLALDALPCIAVDEYFVLTAKAADVDEESVNFTGLNHDCGKLRPTAV